MPAKPKKTIAERLNAAQVGIANTLANPEIKAAVAVFGYPDARLTERQSLLANARKTVSDSANLRGIQKTMSDRFNVSYKVAMAAYQDLSKIVRAVYRNDKAVLTTLGVQGEMPKTTAGFIKAAYVMFDNSQVSTDIKTKLIEYGYPAAKIATERAKIAACDKANQDQESAKGAAQQATREEEKALKDLDLWLAQYFKIAKVALKGHKDWLEKIGVLARDSKTKAQRNAPKKAKATRAAKKKT